MGSQYGQQANYSWQTHKGKGKGNTKGKSRAAQAPMRQPGKGGRFAKSNYRAMPPPGVRSKFGKSKGKGKKGKQGRGKGNKSGSADPNNWIPHSIRGETYCQFWNNGQCRYGNSCNNLHRCPVDRGDGQACNGDHKAYEH
jgi:hypothetical protein